MLNIILLLIFLTLSGSLGGYCFKKASSSDTIIKIIFKPMLYLGAFFYILGASLNIVVLKKLPYTVVLPLTSLTYVWTLIIAHFALKEKITRLKIIGVILILAGSVLLCVKIQL